MHCGAGWKSSDKESKLMTNNRQEANPTKIANLAEGETGRVIALNIPADLIDKNAEHVEYIRCEAEQLPLADNAADTIIIAGANYVVSLRELFRVLKMRGRLLSMDVSADDAAAFEQKLAAAGFICRRVAKNSRVMTLEAEKPFDYTAIIFGDKQAEAHETDPISILNAWMDHPDVFMHGPEHHVLDGAALLVALDRWFSQHPGEAQKVHSWRREQAARLNADEPDEENHEVPVMNIRDAISELIERAGGYPGGACGYLGVCGAAVSAGTAFSIFSVTSPFSDITWSESSALTGSILTRLSTSPGPRCCKRNAYMALQTAGDFLKQHYSIDLKTNDSVRCHYFDKNEECVFTDCVFF